MMRRYKKRGTGVRWRFDHDAKRERRYEIVSQHEEHKI